jgi:hypothetical protein
MRRMLKDSKVSGSYGNICHACHIKERKEKGPAAATLSIANSDDRGTIAGKFSDIAVQQMDARLLED